LLMATHAIQPSTAGDVGPLLTPAEVAKLFRVDPKTVTRWAQSGKLQCVRTLGGHRRYLRSEVEALLAVGRPAAPVPVPELRPTAAD
jgi:excisionase family DNA binding protein